MVKINLPPLGLPLKNKAIAVGILSPSLAILDLLLKASLYIRLMAEYFNAGW